MKIDLGSWAVRLDVKGGCSTPSWGTALGQGKGYIYTFPKQNQYINAMNKCATSPEFVSCPLGKGGKQIKNYRRIRTSIFSKVSVHYENTIKKLTGAKFILIEVEELASFHKGRRSIKYNPRCEYKNGNDCYTNQNCFNKIEEILKINKQTGWFVSQIEFPKPDEIHFFIHSIDKTSFDSIGERKIEMRKALDGNKLFHNTTLDSVTKILMSASKETEELEEYFKFRATRSDCMNDPNECVYGRELYYRLLVVR